MRAILSGRCLTLLIGLVTVLTVTCCQWFTLEDKRAHPEKQPVKDSLNRTGKPPPSLGGVLEAIRNREEIRVGMQVGFVPFQMLDEQGRLIGFDVETAAMTARSLGVGLRIVRQSWGELIPSLVAGKTDLVMSAMTVTPERNMEVVFTRPVLETGRMFLVHRKSAAPFRKFRDLDKPGVFVGFTADGLGKLRIREILTRAGTREFPDTRQALEEVFQRRCHGYVDGEFAIRMACAKNADLVVSRFVPLTYEPIAWAVGPGDSHWLNWLNNFILLIQNDGRLDALKKKWLRDYFLDMGGSSK